MRNAYRAGSFYSLEKQNLISEIAGMFHHPLGPSDLNEIVLSSQIVYGGVVPHAGYVFSGPMAARFYHNLKNQKKIKTIFLFGPNHTGLGPDVSICTEKNWNTPLGNVPLNNELFEKICGSSLIEPDKSAHMYEHSIEVQIPFLQSVFADQLFSIIPIAIKDQSYEKCCEISTYLSTLCKEFRNEILWIASSDFSHYVSRENAEKFDKKALEILITEGADKFYRFIADNQVSSCGYGCITVVDKIISHLFPEHKKDLLGYYTSGDIHSMSEVVGYGSVIYKSKNQGAKV